MADQLDDSEIGHLRLQIEWLHRTVAIYEAALLESAESQPTIVAPRLKQRRPQTALAAGVWIAGIDPWWPRMTLPTDPAIPSPGFASAALAARHWTVTAISVFGLRAASLKRAVGLVQNLQQTSVGFIPVFLTDSPDQVAFVRQGYVFEYFPSAVYRSPDGRLDRARVNARLRVIKQKWSSSAELDLSAPEDLPPERSPSEIPESDSGDSAAGSSGRRPPPTKGRGPRGSGMAYGTRGRGAKSNKAAEVDRQVALIRSSGLFDEAWYLENNPEVAQAGIDPVRHYLRSDARSGRDPHPLFDSKFYARQMLRARARDRQKL